MLYQVEDKTPRGSLTAQGWCSHLGWTAGHGVCTPGPALAHRLNKTLLWASPGPLHACKVSCTTGSRRGCGLSLP